MLGCKDMGRERQEEGPWLGVLVWKGFARARLGGFRAPVFLGRVGFLKGVNKSEKLRMNLSGS